MMRAYLRNLILLGLSCAFTLLLAEAVLRFGAHHIVRDGEWLEVGTVFKHDDPPVGFSLTPGSTRVSVKGGAYVIRDRISTQGFRDVMHPEQKTPGRQRVLILGDSFMYGDGVEMEESMPRRLAAMIPETEFINAGVRAWNLDQEYLYYKERGRSWKPDIVLLAFFINDLIHDRAYEVIDGPGGLPIEYRRTAGARQKEAREIPRGLRGSVSSFLRGRSVLYALVRSRVDGLGRRSTAAPASRRPPEVPYLPIFRVEEPGAADPPEWARARRVLDELRRLVTEDGARFGVIIVPAPWQLSDEAWLGWLDWLEMEPAGYSRRHPSEKVSAWCAGSGTPCLDLLDPFEGRERERLYLAQDFHWTGEGHQVAADAVKMWLDGPFSIQAPPQVKTDGHDAEVDQGVTQPGRD